MKALCNILGLVLFAAIFFYLGVAVEYNRPKQLIITVDNVPSIEQIQQAVGAAVDGKLGPETQRLWEQALFNRYAEGFFTESGAPKR